MRIARILLTATLLSVVAVPANAATWYASAPDSLPPPSGSACTVEVPCTLSYALGTKVVAGDTLILRSGTYPDVLNLNNAAKHSNLTITAMPDVVSSLTFDRGVVVGGVDARPYFSGRVNSAGATTGSSLVTIASGVTGVKLSYLRIRGATYPWDDSGPTGVVRVNAYPFTLDHCEVWNGGILVLILVGQQVVISNNHIHDSSHWAPWPFVYLGNMKTYGTPDVHGIAITNYSNSPVATSYSNGIQILGNTIHDAGGNGIQENTNCYAGQSNFVAYVTIDGNEIYNSMKQNWDSKGTSNVIFSNNISWFGDHTGNPNIDYGHIVMNAPNDCSWSQMNNWEIFNNVFYGSKQYVATWSSQDADSHCRNHHVYNNLMYGNNLAATYADSPVYKMCGDLGSTYYGNTMVNNFGSVRTGGLETSGSGSNVKNNIFMNNGALGNLAAHCYQCTNSGTPSNNYFNGPDGWTTGTNAVFTCYASGNCPGFVNIQSNNYQLLAGSPAKDAGISTLGAPYDKDLLGATRTAPWDLGAFEFGGTKAAVDAVPPSAPTAIVATPFSSTRIDLTWVAATDNVGVTAYTVFRDGVQAGTTSGTSFQDPGRSPATTYVYTLEASDAAGNLSEVSLPAVASTLVADSIAPTAPGAFAAAAPTSTSVTLNWSASSDNIGVTGYRIYRGGALVGTVTGLSFTDAGLTPDTNYSYSAVAFDDGGNVSPASATVTARTLVMDRASLVAAYGFNEGSGTTTADLSGKGNPGTLAGATWTSQGRFGGALAFNGSSSMVSVADSAALHLTAGMTVEAWVNPTNVTAWRTVLIKEQTNALVYGMYASSDINSPSGHIYLGADMRVDGASQLAPSTWTHLATTYDGATLRLFVNGTEVTSRALSGNLPASTNPLRIGGNTVWGEYFSGTIDELRIYSRALSAGEIVADMNTPVAVSNPAPLPNPRNLRLVP